jgi:IS5 family transposase
MDARQQRGLALVQSLKGKRIKQLTGTTWLVPSATNASGGYVVAVANDQRSCTCPDAEAGNRCKHIFAVAYVRHEIEMSDGATVTVEQRITYSQDWPNYNQASREEPRWMRRFLKGLCDGIVQPPHPGRGCKPAHLADVVYAMTMKVYGGTSGRIAEDDFVTCAEKKLITKAPAYNTMFKYAQRPELTPLLKVLVQEAGSVLRPVESTFAIDSSGFARPIYAGLAADSKEEEDFTRKSTWRERKFPKEKRVQQWLKAHAQVGVDTGIITAVEVTASNVHDSTMAIPLLNATVDAGFNVKVLCADKGYLSNEILTAVEGVGGVPYVPFKSNSKPTGESDAWRRLWHMVEARNDEFKATYNKRQIVEAVFSGVKRRFSPNVRAKTFAGGVNEVLLKCLCWNITRVVHAVHELKIEPSFWSRMEAA